jgi:hypothetical protein
MSVREKLSKKPIRDEVTTHGGSRAYSQVRSKISKYANGDPKVVTVEREQMMQKLGYDPGPNVTANHKEFGSHFSKKGEPFKMGTRAENTAESNKHRAKKVREKILKP